MRMRDPRRGVKIGGPQPNRRAKAESKSSSASGSGRTAEAHASGPVDTLELTIGPVAHGGHCVARIASGPEAGRVVFVRHALPGEKVLARITDRGKTWRADAICVLENPSPYRVPSTWPVAGPGGVGGAELAHVNPEGQRLWKAAVVAEQMRRLAGVDLATVAPELAVSALTFRPLRLSNGQAGAERERAGGEAVPNWPAGAGYRTRIDLIVGPDGRAGMRQARSHKVVPLTDMPLATPQLRQYAETIGAWTKRWQPGAHLTLVAPMKTDGSTPASANAPLLVVDGKQVPRADGSVVLLETVNIGGTSFQYHLAPTGFWQVHARAPQVLGEAVLAAAGPVETKNVLELYAGAGLFTLPLAVEIGSRGKLTTIEGSKVATEFAQQNLSHLKHQIGASALPKTEQLAGSVDRTLTKIKKANPQVRFDLVIADPPREGLEKGVAEQLAGFGPARIVYVSCDPAALARDTGRLAQHGYRLTSLRAFDLFPMTHHVECVAQFDLAN